MQQLIHNVISFAHMGGYALFVWPSYSAMLILFLLHLFLPIRQFRKLKAKLRSRV